MQGAALGQPEGDSEHPGVGAVGDVHQACLAEDLGADPQVVKEVEDVVLRTGPGVHPAVLGDNQVRVLGDQRLPSCEAGSKGGNRDGVDRDSEAPTPEDHPAPVQVDVFREQVAELVGAGPVQEAEQPRGSLVGVDVGTGPTSQQFPLL